MNWYSICDYEKYQKSRNTVGDEAERIFKKWAEGKDVEKVAMNKPWNVAEFIETKKDTYRKRYSSLTEVYPFQDHCITIKGKNEIYVIYQPYEHIEEDGRIDEIKEYFNNLGLNCTVTKEDSWHCPGRTHLVCVTAKED